MSDLTIYVEWWLISLTHYSHKHFDYVCVCLFVYGIYECMDFIFTTMNFSISFLFFSDSVNCYVENIVYQHPFTTHSAIMMIRKKKKNKSNSKQFMLRCEQLYIMIYNKDFQCEYLNECICLYVSLYGLMFRLFFLF